MKALKKWLRALSLRFESYTCQWVVPRHVHALMLESHPEALAEAKAILEETEKEWPYDPEVTRVQTLISFLEGKD